MAQQELTFRSKFGRLIWLAEQSHLWLGGREKEKERNRSLLCSLRESRRLLRACLWSAFWWRHRRPSSRASERESARAARRASAKAACSGSASSSLARDQK